MKLGVYTPRTFFWKAFLSIKQPYLIFLESIFIDQAALNGTRLDSPLGVKPARPLVGRYFMVQFQEWVQLPRICPLPGLVVGPQPHR
jgi:hypothetical protein